MIDFTEQNGKRSSQSAGKAIFSAAAAPVNPSLAERISSAQDWRKGYIEPVRDLVASGVASDKAALQVAQAGLAAVREHVVDTEGERSLPELLRDAPAGGLRTESVRGQGERKQRLEIPYRGSILRGESLRERLDRWVADGVLEPSAAANATEVLENPHWLDLSDTNIALLGAASEMGPLAALCSWGAHVIAIDLPRPYLWEHIIGTARAGAGRLSYPVTEEGPGSDLMADPAAVAAWLAGFEGPLTIGNYVYADGGNFVLLSAVVDTLLEEVARDRSDVSFSYLATPTDVFAVTEEVVQAARGSTGAFGRVARALSRGNLYTENYSTIVASEDGRSWGIYDCLVPQQGANYALAKSIQRWRAIEAKTSGIVMSANVAPATRTRSVVKNKILASAYAGAHRFGVEIFEPATSRALMAALLVYDLRSPRACAASGTTPAHPYELFVDGAVHGGLWRLHHAPRSILPLAVIGGLAKRKS